MTQIEMRMENLRNHVSQRYQNDLEAFEPDSYALVTSFRDRSKKKTSRCSGDGLRGPNVPGASAG